MRWLCVSDDEWFELEVRCDDLAVCYSVVWHNPNGATRTDAFPSPDVCREHLDAIREELAAEGWQVTSLPPAEFPSQAH